MFIYIFSDLIVFYFIFRMDQSLLSLKWNNHQGSFHNTLASMRSQVGFLINVKLKIAHTFFQSKLMFISTKICLKPNFFIFIFMHCALNSYPCFRTRLQTLRWPVMANSSRHTNLSSQPAVNIFRQCSKKHMANTLSLF